MSEYDEATALANTPVALSFPLLVLSDMITVEVVEVVLVVVTFFPTCRKSRDYTKVEVIDRTVVRRRHDAWFRLSSVKCKHSTDPAAV